MCPTQGRGPFTPNVNTRTALCPRPHHPQLSANMLKWDRAHGPLVATRVGHVRVYFLSHPHEASKILRKGPQALPKVSRRPSTHPTVGLRVRARGTSSTLAEGPA